MANMMDWLFPCFSIGRSENPQEDIQRPKKQLPGTVPFEERPGLNNVPYRTSIAGSMYYLRVPPALKTDQITDVAKNPGQGTVKSNQSDPAYEMRPMKQPHVQASLSKLGTKPGRPGLTVCIPPSKSKLPVEKSHLSPDSALENRQALEMADAVDKPARGKGARSSLAKSAFKTPLEKSAFSAGSSVASEQPSAKTNPFETPAYTRWRRAQEGMTTVMAPKKVNLKDELDVFSIASREEELSAFSEKTSARSTKAVSKLRACELKSSIHDWAHEEHRDLTTRLTPNCLQIARRVAQDGGTSSEA
ncbi:MAG: hypothetical protein Q9225_003123 [Loekoesia sp. 1 TL-2023]